MGTTPPNAIDLGHDLHLSWAFGAGTVQCELALRGDVIASATVSVASPTGTARVDTADVDAELQFVADFAAGTVTWSGDVRVRDPLANPPWTSVAHAGPDVLVRFDPTAGAVDGSPTPHPPVVDPVWGASGPSGHGITRFHVSTDERALADVGRIVKAELFDHLPPFAVNVVACCGRPTGPNAPGVYGDPESHWFNGFFGTYQIDCAKADGWTRPFGYESAAGVTSTTHDDDLVRLGVADWNWFSNYLYGVPHEICEQYSTVDLSSITFSPVVTATIGSSAWHTFTLSGVTVSSCYESATPGAARLVANSPLTPSVQHSFGLPCPRPEFPTSFIPTELQSSATMAYWEDEAGYHTITFGGTCVVAAPAGFLDAQTAAARAVIAEHYPTRGFGG
jgi:hypothetical protein